MNRTTFRDLWVGGVFVKTSIIALRRSTFLKQKQIHHVIKFSFFCNPTPLVHQDMSRAYNWTGKTWAFIPFKPLSLLAVLPLRLHGVVQFEDGDVTTFSRRPWYFYGAPWRSCGVLVGDCLRSHGASTAFIELSRRAHCVCTACLRSSQCAVGVLFAFVGSWNNCPHIADQAWAYMYDTW